jgi:hypothetical protein
MKKNHIISVLSLLTIILVVLSLIFMQFPFMGHDYYYYIGLSHDYHFAWKNFGVFNILFTPQRCSGVPVWSNPISMNFSLFHGLSIFLKDINVIVAYCSIVLTASYFGTKKFLSLFKLSEPWNTYVTIAWCLQGYITARAIVGHISFINIGLWPFYVYLLIKKNDSTKKNLLTLILFAFANTHEFYIANIYLFVMFHIAFIIFLMIAQLNRLEIDYKWILKRFFMSSILTSFLILPKVLAGMQLIRNFQRNSSFFHVDLIDSLNYIMMNLVTPLPLDYQKMTGWGIGNWESVSYIFPFLLPVLLCKAALELKKYSRILISLFGLILLGVLIVHGSYAEIIKTWPVIKSFHVNPRWIPVINLGLLTITILFLKEAQFKTWTAYLFTIIVVAIPFTFIGQSYFGVNYIYRAGLDTIRNRQTYCYEPVFGYRHELLPIKELKGKYFDPRCFVSRNKCKDVSLKPELYQKLESYSLEPFPE